MSMLVALLSTTPEILIPKLEKLAKRAKKMQLEWNWHQVDGVTYQQRYVPYRWAEDEFGSIEPTHWRMELVGAARIEVEALPRIAGCEFLARIEHTPAGNLVSKIGNVSVPEKYWTAQPICEHCKQSRNRRDTFLLNKLDNGVDAGNLIQVGRTCLADYLRSADPTKLLQEYIAIVSDAEPGSGGGVWMISTIDYVAAALSSVERRGYRKSSEPESTRSDASWICGTEPSDREVKKAWREAQPTPEQRERAEALIAWAQALTKGFDYEENLRIAAALPMATSRTQGLLASLPVAYAKANQELVKKQNPDREVDPGYFAPVKARVDATVTILRTISVPGDWGDKLLYVFRTAEGHDLVWFCSGSILRTADGAALTTGATVQLRGTVKRHELRKGRHQTVMIRCKVLSVPQATQGAA